jgi:predicted nucleotidyltransferase
MPRKSPFEADALVQSARTTPGLELLLMFGSRARGEAQDESDWDFGYLATDGFDATALLSAIVESVGTDRVDVVDLRRAGGLLRYRAARDGQLIYEGVKSSEDPLLPDVRRRACGVRAVRRRASSW